MPSHSLLPKNQSVCDMANHRVEYIEDEEEALFNSYTFPSHYYVQSPSTLSHAHSSEYRSSDSFIPSRPSNPNRDIARLILSRYSSHGSTNTFHHEKKLSYDMQSHETNVGGESGGLLMICGVEEENGKEVEYNEHGEEAEEDEEEEEEEEDEEDEYGGEGKRGRRKGCWRFFSFGENPSCCWVLIQMSWRFLVSFGVALLVFYLATNPPPPTMLMKVRGLQFGLGEGVDQSGVSTKILTCNCSMVLNVENKSKLFGLHIHPSVVRMSFGPLVFASSQGTKLYAETYGSSKFTLNVATKKKAIYGAGRNMQDMLESRKGLPLIIRLKLRSNFKVVGNLVNPKFHHKIECVLVLHGNKGYRSDCKIVSTS